MKNYIFLILSLIIISCAGETVYSPKPRMYPKVDYPQKSYSSFDENFCNLTFEIPTYTSVVQEARFFDEKSVDPCWFDLEYPDFNGSLHFSYYPVDGIKSFDRLVQDAFKFVEKHDIKANYRSETIVHNKYGASGILFDIDGPVATPLQFFLSDSTNHFIRASLYFENKVDPDSMAPIYSFVREDVLKMMETMRFINP